MRTRKKDFNYYTSKKYDGMMGRCYREKDRSFCNYGAKGIAVAGSWIRDISSFRDWFSNELIRIGLSVEDFVRDSKKYQLDRINSDGHYVPENCRLVSLQANMRNRKTTIVKEIVSAEGEKIKL